ncbi:MAG: DUF3376 domain-containing protein, partial [Armatimonadota bacterium]|nr:DUF3376 domain-containing protein [Armatimonadota bacterium]
IEALGGKLEERFQTYSRVRSRVVELYHLRDLAEIVLLNVIAVVDVLPCCPEYDAAAAAALAETTPNSGIEAINTFWSLLVGCLDCLLVEGLGRLLQQTMLRNVPVRTWPETIPKEQLSGDREGRDQRHQRDAERLHEQLATLTEKICKALRGQDGEQSQREREEYITRAKLRHRDDTLEGTDAATQTIGDRTVVARLDARANKLVQDAVQEWLPALKKLKLKQTTTGTGADDGANGAANVKNTALPQRDTVPLGWAIVDGQVCLEKKIGTALDCLDVFLFPIERAADLANRNYIELVQISPRDVQIGLSAKDAMHKLAGDVLGNFGGFLKSSWRANDILWGRLDASGAILETMLDASRLERILRADAKARRDDPKLPGPASDKRMMEALDDYICRGDVCRPDGTNYDDSGSDDIGRLLWADYQKDWPSLADWLTAVHEGRRRLLERDPEFKLLRDWLLRRHQLEILVEEVPETIAEAMAEHAQWQGRNDAADWKISGTHKPPPAAPASPHVPNVTAQDAADVARQGSRIATSLSRLCGYQPDRVNLDMIRQEAHERAKGIFTRGNRNPDAKPIYAYFRHRYRIGEETVQDDIPPLVTMRRIVAALLIVLHVLGNSMSPGFKSGMVGSRVMQWLLKPLSLLVGTLYGFATVLTYGRAAAGAAHGVAWTVLIAAAAAVLFYPKYNTLPWIVWVLTATAALFELLVWWCSPNPLRGLARVLCLLGIGLCVYAHFDETAAHYLLWQAGIYAIGTAFLLRLTGWLGWETVALAVVGFALWQMQVHAVLLGKAALPDPFTALGSQKTLVWRLLFTSTAVVGAVLYFMPPRNPDLVDLERAGRADIARDILRIWGTVGQRWAILNVGIDFLIIPLYSTTLALACVIVADMLGIDRWPVFWRNMVYVLAATQWLAGLLDVVENYALIRMLLFDEVTDRQARVAHVGATIKSLLRGLGIAFVILGLLVQLGQHLLWK